MCSEDCAGCEICCLDDGQEVCYCDGRASILHTCPFAEEITSSIFLNAPTQYIGWSPHKE